MVALNSSLIFSCPNNLDSEADRKIYRLLDSMPVGVKEDGTGNATTDLPYAIIGVRKLFSF